MAINVPDRPAAQVAHTSGALPGSPFREAVPTMTIVAGVLLLLLGAVSVAFGLWLLSGESYDAARTGNWYLAAFYMIRLPCDVFLVIAGALCLWRRLYAVCIAGAIFAILPLCTSSWPLGLPVGAGILALLLSKDVRGSFR